MKKQVGSVQLEVQARSCEYGRIFKYETIRPQLLEHMPALDEATYSRSLGSSLPADTAAAAPQVVRLDQRATLCHNAFQMHPDI